ncbi:MAG: PHP domain-containing protein [Candidatus Coatesbacteria bacterium]|nr:PHP domain-containing protein [Candidatus Coatesbacteria bacterium]
MPEIDLHLHSTASDGTCSPMELVRMSAKMGLSAIAIADHDTVAGVLELRGQELPPGLELVPAIEIGSHFLERSLHILGYFINPLNDGLRQFMDWKLDARRARAEEIVRKLSAGGIPIDMDAVLEVAAGGALGRAHIARVLVERGAASSVNEAFDLYLKRRSPYFVPMMNPDPFEAIALIRAAGGVASLAHPIFLRDSFLQEVLPMLLDAGLQAIEVLYGFDPDFGLTVEEHLHRCSEISGLAAAYGLARTGGSDFHGAAVKYQSIGSAHVPLSFLEELKSRHRGGLYGNSADCTD